MVALIFIFNHKYDKNIEVLENIYKDRFSNIYYLVPFYEGSKANVIPVYENSIYFQGYLSQGLKHYFNEKYEHYFFIADDLILNPEINEHNYKEHFNIGSADNFIPEIHSLHNLSNNDTLRFAPVKSITGKKKWYWIRIRELVLGYKHGVYGAENTNEMPSYADAAKILQNYGYETKPFTHKDVYGDVLPIAPASVRYMLHLKSYFKKINPVYPLVGAYSDILIINKYTIKKFCHYCGVFATNKLFVEFAIPTALLLTGRSIVTQNKTIKKGKIYWLYTQQELANYNKEMEQYNKNLNELLNKFPKNSMYIHPIKLSKWTYTKPTVKTNSESSYFANTTH